MIVASCTKDVGYTNPGGYPQEIGGIVVNRCAIPGCHSGESYNATAGLNLSSWESMFRGSVNGSPVIPFSSRFSSLCYFINTYPELGDSNQPTMPLNETPLSAEEVKRIQSWIDQGAPNSSGQVKWAEDPLRAKLYAVNQGCDVVTVFDAATRLPMRYITVGNKAGTDSPHHVRVSPDGKFWYVVFLNNNVMQKFRCSDDSYVGDIPLTPAAAGTGNADMFGWNTFVITADGRKAFSAAWAQNGALAAVDLEKMKLINFLGGQYFPHAIVLGPGDRTIFVGAQTGNYITEFDTSLAQSGSEYSLEPGQLPNTGSSVDPHDIVLSPDGKQLWITCIKTNEVRVFDLSTHSVTSKIPTGTYPQEIVYSPSTGAYFVSCMRDSIVGRSVSIGSVVRINAQTHATSKLVVGHQPHGLASDDSRQTLYVLSRNVTAGGQAPHHSAACEGNNGFVDFVDLQTFRKTGPRYELSVDPYFIYLRP
jgi:YVTN family beta-propeller protein